MQPIIGISAGKELSDTNIQKICLIDKYTQAIIHSGGIPLIIPTGISENSIPTIFQSINGILLTGGGDIETQRFKGDDHPKVYGIDPDRDHLEIELVLAAIKYNKPLLGICRGIQVINVTLGGDLFTDISDQKPAALRHDWFPNHPRDLLAHKVVIETDSTLLKIVKLTQFKVNSLHHQAIRNLSKQLTASAFSPDGIIEAVELKNHPYLIGVQWHPEWIYSMEPTTRIFNSFINAAKKHG
ncbi:MAG TPA: gamma-glutamyl-gamma-aminobutyrate hydrolase family protein [Anaerolineaceae bacterium]|nr:gamma-glutamyl-gamma-aminobutyrate hydrolase family protein [Anaerolineaceae bacterium]